MSEQETTTLSATAAMTPDLPFETALEAKISELIALFTEYNRGGFKTRELISFTYECIYSLALLAKLYTDLPERDKQEKIIQALRQVYMSRNPDLPWIPEPFEAMMESMVFSIIAPELYKFLVRVL